jgi:hypothetical protein
MARVPAFQAGCCGFESHLMLLVSDNVNRVHPRTHLLFANVAQLVERNLAKVDVVGSNPIIRSVF